MKIKLPKPRKPKYWEILVTWTILTVGGLFGGQYWFESWSMATAYRSEMPANGQAMAELKAAQHQKMASASLSIEEAMQRVAQANRNTIPLIAPEPSADMGPAAGWMHHPDFVAPPEFDPQDAPAPEEVAPEEGALEEGALEEGEEATEETEATEEAPEAPSGGTGRPETAAEPGGAGGMATTMAPTAMMNAPDAPAGMATAPAMAAAMAPAAMAPMTAMTTAPAAPTATDTE
jgi:hypothetical protein